VYEWQGTAVVFDMFVVFVPVDASFKVNEEVVPYEAFEPNRKRVRFLDDAGGEFLVILPGR